MIKKLIIPAALFSIIYTSPLLGITLALEREHVTVQKEIDNKIDMVKTFLKARAVGGQIRIWVFFTDKQFFNKTGPILSSTAIKGTEKALSRRSKMNRGHTLFGDIPVSDNYIREISSKGGKLRRISRWLNAASFEVPFDLIDDINNLPFVAKIRPVAVYRQERPEPVISPEKLYAVPSADTYTLDYGASLPQMEQVHVPVIHDMGYNGSGVIVAMFDTGYLKDHQAFAAARVENRIEAEYDFIFDDYETQNEAEADALNQHNHGTYTWSTLGGAYSGRLYGPAYGATFILAKTEDVRSETQVEEDNWVAAVEWADSIGADVISSSLAYSDWYSYSDFDGESAITTIAANTATALGIVVCNAMANSGPGLGTLHAPADAFEIISCGAVDASGSIAYFSSRGPTADGRTKPEVCARGVSTYCATTSDLNTYGGINGTSLSTPIVGGCAALLLSIYPSLTPQAVRLAFMETACNAENPDNAYGWGIVNMEAVLDWGAKVGANVRSGQVPLEVDFFDSSYIPTSNWRWFFSPDDSTEVQNPSFTYTVPGVYPVTLYVTTAIGRQISTTQEYFIIAQADTISFGIDTVFAGQTALIEVNLVNTQNLNNLIIPVDFSSGFDIELDSFSVVGTRAENLNSNQVAGSTENAVAIQLTGVTPLSPGSGTILWLYLTPDQSIVNGGPNPIDTTTIDDLSLSLANTDFSYVPFTESGILYIRDILRGDANSDNTINIGDAVFLTNYVFSYGSAPLSNRAGDANSDDVINVGDAVFLINHMFHDGPPPAEE